MPTFQGSDAAQLHYDDLSQGDGDGVPLITLAGGAGRHPSYLGDLAGLGARRRLIVVHLRGVGSSPLPDAVELASFWRQAEDIERLRVHLGLERVWLLGHSAGTRLAISYGVQFPDRLAGLVLITPPAGYLVDVAADADDLMDKRRGEPAFDAALAAWAAGPEVAGRDAAGRDAADGDAPGGDASHDDALNDDALNDDALNDDALNDDALNDDALNDDALNDDALNDDAFNAWQLRLAPISYAAWGVPEQAHAAIGRFSFAANRAYFSVDPPPDLAARLGQVTAPVLVIGGAEDSITGVAPVTALAKLFPTGELVLIERCGHFPWVEQPAAFRLAVGQFLDRSDRAPTVAPPGDAPSRAAVSGP